MAIETFGEWQSLLPEGSTVGVDAIGCHAGPGG